MWFANCVPHSLLLLHSETMRRCYLIAIAAVLSFLPARAEEQPHTVLSAVSNTVLSGYVIVPVQPLPTTLPASISVRAAKRLMHEDSFMTPGGGRLPAAFILRRTGNTNEELTVFFELTGTATVDVDYTREVRSPMGGLLFTTGPVQTAVFAPGERVHYVYFQMNPDGDLERFESVRLRILPLVTLHAIAPAPYRPGPRGCASIWITDLPACVRTIPLPNGGYHCAEYRPLVPPPAFFIADRCR